MKLLRASILILILIPVLGFGQSRQEDTTSTYKSLIPEEKQKKLKNIDFIMNMHMNYRVDFRDNKVIQGKFRIEQLRWEIKGYVNKWLYFRFRHRLTSLFQPQSIDKIIKGVDFAYVRFDVGKKKNWQITVGKTFADWGGWEFDLNPIDIYEYSDIIEYADNFLTGVGAYWQMTKNHGLSFQVLNSRTSTFEEIYDTVPNVEASKFPLAGVINWRGSFWGGKITTLWSYSLFSEAQGIFKNYIALGTQLKTKHFDIAYDYKLSIEDLDRTGIISNEIPDTLYNYSVRNTLYQSHWVRMTGKFAKRWQISLDLFVDFADWRGNIDPLKNENRFRTVWSFVPTIEVFPLKRVNLKIFLGYVGRYYVYSNYAKSRPGFGLSDYNTGRVIFGIISPLEIL